MTTPAPPAEPRVSDERVNDCAKYVDLGGRPPSEIDDLVLDLRDARATIASQAEALAAKEAENESQVRQTRDWMEAASREAALRFTAEAELTAAREALGQISALATNLCDVIATTELHGDDHDDSDCHICEAHKAMRAALALTKGT